MLRIRVFSPSVHLMGNWIAYAVDYDQHHKWFRLYFTQKDFEGRYPGRHIAAAEITNLVIEPEINPAAKPGRIDIVAQEPPPGCGSLA